MGETLEEYEVIGDPETSADDVDDVERTSEGVSFPFRIRDRIRSRTFNLSEGKVEVSASAFWEGDAGAGDHDCELIVSLLRDDSPWPWRDWQLVGSFRLKLLVGAEKQTRTFHTKEGPHRLTFVLEERQHQRECVGGANVFKLT